YALILLLVSFLALVLWYFQYYSKKNR
ncbi:DedA family protein, partial [Staphylococcus pseudintermedius]